MGESLLPWVYNAYGIEIYLGIIYLFKNVCAFLLKIVLTDTDLHQEPYQDKLDMDGRQLFQIVPHNVMNKNAAWDLNSRKNMGPIVVDAIFILGVYQQDHPKMLTVLKVTANTDQTEPKHSI